MNINGARKNGGTITIERIRIRGEPKIVALQPDHWRSVRSIHLEAIATGNSTFERKVPEWEEWNASFLDRGRFVAMAGEQVVGWSAMSMVSARPVYNGVAELTIAVAAAARGQGVGKALMKNAIDASEANNIWMLQASLFPENEAALKLYEAFGFREVGRRERIAKHFSRWRDLILLERRSRRVGAPPPPGRRRS